MKLYLVHCGFYDPVAGDGIYEIHTNLFVVAESFADAKLKAKALPEYQKKKMHVDGIQEIEKVQGYEMVPTKRIKKDEATVIHLKRSTFGS
jgi:hypothetical protein